MNAQQLAAFALTNGAELSIDGRTINPGRERFPLSRPKAAPAQEAAPAQPAPAQASAGLSEAEVRQMVDSLRANVEQQMQQLILLMAQQPRGQDPPPPPNWVFIPEYDQKDRLINIQAVASRPAA